MLVPITVLAPFPEHIGDWLVPGLLVEKCVALIKTLPKSIRKNFAPAVDSVDRVFDDLRPENKPLVEVFASLLYKSRGVEVSGDDFRSENLASYYCMNYRVLDVDGSVINEGRDLSRLKDDYAHSVKKSIHSSNAPERLRFEKQSLSSWSFEELPRIVEYQHQGMTVQAYPMLKAQGDGSVSLRVHDSIDVANYHTHHGMLALARTVLSQTTHKQSLKALKKELMAKKPPTKNAGLNDLAAQLKDIVVQRESESEWVDKLIDAALAAICFDNKPTEIRNRKDFLSALDKAKGQWVAAVIELEQALLAALKHRDTVLNLANSFNVESIESDLIIEDIKSQVYQLFEPSFLSYTPLATLKQYPRYLRAITIRLEKANVRNNANKQEIALLELQNAYDDKVAELSNSQFAMDYVFLTYPALSTFKIMLEEWRVSIFAQHLRTQIRVSDKRLRSFWNDEIAQL
jgi:ATP-dependent helicase HrpA